jgi:regulator of sigma E protease
LLGGYVSMEGETEKSTDPRAFNNKPMWAKLLVVLMGSLVNIGFAVISIFIIIISLGQYESTTIDYISENSAGYRAGLRVGDKITYVNNQKIRVKDDITEFLRINKEAPITVRALKGGRKENVSEFSLIPDKIKTGYVGMEFAIEGDKSINVVKSVQVDSPALLAGIKEGDKIIGINNVSTTDPVEIDYIIKQNADVEIPITIERGGEIKTLNMTPVCPEILAKYVIGFIGSVSNDKPGLVYHAFWQSCTEVKKMINQVAELVTGKISPKYLSGPIGVATVISKTDFGIDLLTLSIFISLNLGIVNLFPLPPLDGGKIVFLLIEGITKKPVSEKVEYYFQLTGFALLIGLMLFVTFNDITRRLSIF